MLQAVGQRCGSSTRNRRTIEYKESVRMAVYILYSSMPHQRRYRLELEAILRRSDKDWHYYFLRKSCSWVDTLGYRKLCTRSI